MRDPQHIQREELSHRLGFSIEQVAREASLDWFIEREQEVGVLFGPFHRERQLRSAPEKVRRILAEMQRASFVGLEASSQGFTDMGDRGFPPANLRAAIASTTTETNLWDPGIHCTLPVGTIQAGKCWTVRAGGVAGTTGTPTIVGTTRIGTNNSAPPTGTTLGASNTVTMPTISAQPFKIFGDYGCRVNGVAASGAAITGDAVIFFSAAAAATVTPHVICGGSVAATSIDETVLQGIGVSITWGTSSASNTLTPQWVKRFFDN